MGRSTQLIAKDLSACVQAEVQVELFGLNDDLHNKTSGLLVAQPEGVCIDDALANTSEKVALCEHPDASLLSIDKDLNSSSILENTGTEPYTFYSNLLRSNCPVTINQIGERWQYRL